VPLLRSGALGLGFWLSVWFAVGLIDAQGVDGDRLFFTHSDGTLAAFFDRTILLDWRIVTEDELAAL